MMLYPAMNELLDKVPSRYQLVNVVAARARKIASKAEREERMLEDKPVSIAIREIAEGVEMEEEEVLEAAEVPEEAEEAAQSLEPAPSPEDQEAVQEQAGTAGPDQEAQPEPEQAPEA